MENSSIYASSSCYRLRENGWRVVWAQHVWVNHLQAQAAPEGELAEISKRDHALLEERWPGKLLREANVPMSPPKERPGTPESVESIRRFHADLPERFGRVPITWDLGCGEGWGAEHYEPGTYVGFDISEQAIAKAKERHPQHFWICADMESLERVRMADRILAIQSLEHVRDPEAVVRRVASTWLKSGGDFFMSVPIEERTLYSPHHISYRTKEQWEATLREVFPHVEIGVTDRDIQAYCSKVPWPVVVEAAHAP